MADAKHTPVTEADIQSAREYLANVHNRTQLVNAISHLRRDVVIAMAARKLVPSYYRAAKATGSAS